MNRFALLFAFLGFLPSAWGQLLVSDRATSQVLEYDSVTGEFLRVLVPSDPSKLIAPSAMTVMGDELLVASLFTGSVVRYDLETGAHKGNFASQINGPSGLLYREATDELFVSTFGNFDGELIMRYKASTGELLSAIGEGSGRTGRGSMLIGPDDNIYVSSFAAGEFFTAAVLQVDGQALTVSPAPFALDPFLAGGSGLALREVDDGFQLDLVGLFSNNVGRFALRSTDEGLAVTGSSLIIPEGLDFPSAILDLDDTTMLVTNLGNDDPAQGELRGGSIARYNIATGEKIDTFIAAGGPGNLTQPTALVLLSCVPPGVIPGDLNGDGEVVFNDFLKLAFHFGQPGGYAEGDIDCNGMVEFADFLKLAANFGRGVAGAAAVPEPSGLAQLLTLGLALPWAWRRRTRRAR